MTWEEIKSRSEGEIRLGHIPLACWDCFMNYHLVEMPCERHCLTDDEKKERTQRYATQLEDVTFRVPEWIKK